MIDPARTARTAGFFAGVALVLGAAVAEGAGLLQLRLLLWIAAGVLAGPALLHALWFGFPPAPGVPRRTRGAVAQLAELPPAPARAAVAAARAARGGLPPSPKARQLTS